MKKDSKLVKTNWKTGVAALTTLATLAPMSSVLADQFYYNANTGGGAVTYVDRAGNVPTTKVYGSGTFSTGWTQVVNTPDGIFFYNASNGAAAVGVLDRAGNFTNLNSYAPGTFTTGWTSIVNN